MPISHLRLEDSSARTVVVMKQIAVGDVLT